MEQKKFVFMFENHFRDEPARPDPVAFQSVVVTQRPHKGVSKRVRYSCLAAQGGLVRLKEVWRRSRCAIAAPNFSHFLFIFKVIGCCFGAGQC